MVLLFTQRSDRLVHVCLEWDVSHHNVQLLCLDPKYPSDFYHPCLNEQCNRV